MRNYIKEINYKNHCIIISDECLHLIITGKNGSGKTKLLRYLKNIITDNTILIDNIDKGLHVFNQQTILPDLIKNNSDKQFIVTTHSPIVMTSTDNCMIYNMDTKLLVDNYYNIPQNIAVDFLLLFTKNINNDTFIEWFNYLETLSKKNKLSDKERAKFLNIDGNIYSHYRQFMHSNYLEKYWHLRNKILTI